MKSDFSFNELIQQVPELCEKIRLQPEASALVLPQLDSLNALIADIEGLIVWETGERSYKRLNEQCGGNDMRLLAAFLTAAIMTKAIYRQKGIDSSVFYDTMGSFSRFVGEHMLSYGKVGFDRGWWTWRHTACRLFRIGTLEFEMMRLNVDTFGDARRGDNYVSIHIPSNAMLTRSALNQSYDAGAAFLRQHNFEYVCAGTTTWLLSPFLKPLLPEGSRIVEFQKDYDIIAINPDNNGFMRWVFKRAYDDYQQLPETTTLQKNIKHHLLAGGKIGVASGVLRRGEEHPLTL